MIEGIFTGLTTALSGNLLLALLAAFAWGLASVLLSPCHLSSIPLIIGYITGREEKSVRKAFSQSLIFSIGMFFSIVLIGIITGAMGRLMGDLGVFGDWLLALVFILMGLYLLDWLPLNWSQFSPNMDKSKGWKGALILGFILGIGLGPCTFAFMAPVMVVVFNTAAESILTSALLVLLFALGHCLLIVLAGTLSGWVQNYLNWSDQSKSLTYIKKAMGFLIAMAGVYFAIDIIF
jgi:cytochrome c-type biogenesis protein